MAFKCQYVDVRIARNPMCIITKSVLSHEVFILTTMFAEVHVLGPTLDAKGEPSYRTVERDAEYERLAQAYGKNRDTETPKVMEVFGQPASKSWGDALKEGVDFSTGAEDEGPDELPETPLDGGAGGPKQPGPSFEDGINVDGVRARLDELEIEYDPDMKAAELVELLQSRTQSMIESLGGTVDEGASLEQMTVALEELREQEEKQSKSASRGKRKAAAG